MPGLLSKVASLARSPQGKRALAQAQKMAKDPATKQKIADARGKLSSRGKKPS